MIGLKTGVQAEDPRSVHSSEADKTRGSLFTSSDIDPKMTERVREIPVGRDGWICILPSFSSGIGYRMQLISDPQVCAHDLCP